MLSVAGYPLSYMVWLGVFANTEISCLEAVAHQLQYNLIEYSHSFKMSLLWSSRTIRNLNYLTVPCSVSNNSLFSLFTLFLHAWSTQCYFSILDLAAYRQAFLVENIWRVCIIPVLFFHLAMTKETPPAWEGKYRQALPSSPHSWSKTEMQVVVDRV